MTKYLGIDPGQTSGGFAQIHDGSVWASPFPLAGGFLDANKLASWWSHAKHDTIAIIEKAQAMPKQGVTSTFSYGVGYGKILGVLATLGIRTEFVRPTSWKKLVLADTTKDKAAAIYWCRCNFPLVSLIAEGCRVPHDGMADALCIAEYGRRTFASAADPTTS